MNIEKIVSIVTANLSEEFPGIEVKNTDVVKNGRTLTGILAKPSDSNIGPTAYINDIEGTDEEIAERITEILRDAVRDLDSKTEGVMDVVKKIRDWEFAKTRIRSMLIKTEGNEKFLEDRPHVEFLDLSKCFDLVIDEARGMTAPIKNDMMDHWGVTAEDLEKAEQMPDVTFQSMAEILGVPEMENMPLYVLTNGRKFKGASLITRENVLKDVSERVGGDFVLLPSSIHEVIIVPVDQSTGKMDEFTEMVKFVNNNEVDPTERLSDHAYLYTNGALQIA